MQMAAHLFLLLSVGLVSALALQPAAPAAPERSVIFVAHRGGIVPGFPENTLAAFREAIRHGVHVIEVDLRGTRDGAVVIMHDETVDRTTNGHGKVTDQTLEELKKLDAGHGERIPTYEDVLQAVAGTGVALLLDIKPSAVLDKAKVVRLTEKHNAVLNVIVGARSIEDLRAFQSLNRNLRTLGFMQEAGDLEAFSRAGVGIIRLWPQWIDGDPSLIEKVHNLGKPVWTTAGDAPRGDLKKLIERGVDGILSDFPALVSEISNR